VSALSLLDAQSAEAVCRAVVRGEASAIRLLREAFAAIQTVGRPVALQGESEHAAATGVIDPPPDGPRYAAMGNAVTVNVVHWIGSRIVSYEEGRLAA
jgi:N-acetylglucosamine kinase-like BadF-type ATPase